MHYSKLLRAAGGNEEQVRNKRWEKPRKGRTANKDGSRSWSAFSSSEAHSDRPNATGLHFKRSSGSLLQRQSFACGQRNLCAPALNSTHGRSVRRAKTVHRRRIRRSRGRKEGRKEETTRKERKYRAGFRTDAPARSLQFAGALAN